MKKVLIYILYIPNLADRKACHTYLRKNGYNNKMSAYLKSKPVEEKAFYRCKHCYKYIVTTNDGKEKEDHYATFKTQCTHCDNSFNFKYNIDKNICLGTRKTNCIVFGSAIEEERNKRFNTNNMNNNFKVSVENVYVMKAPNKFFNKEEMDDYISNNELILFYNQTPH